MENKEGSGVSKTFKNSVKTCARCGRDHDEVTFNPVTNHSRYTHFGKCPTTEQPILMRVTSDTEPESNLMSVPCLMDSKRLGVAIVIQRAEDGKYLANERQNCRDQNGLYQFPGGGLDDCTESAYNAAVRELHEETGLVLGALEFLCIGIGLTPDGEPHVTTFFKGTVRNQTPVDTELDKHGPWGWFSAAELREIPLIDLCRPVLEKIEADALPQS